MPDVGRHDTLLKRLKIANANQLLVGEGPYMLARIEEVNAKLGPRRQTVAFQLAHRDQSPSVEVGYADAA